MISGNRMPEISVVLPVYNGERFVGEAIDSILAQTAPDFELIVINDGSKDRTRDIIDAFANRDSRVVPQHQTVNKGFVEALNAGCRAARGRFIARMDADDVSVPDRFARQVEYLRAHPDVGVLGGGFQLIDQDGATGRSQQFPTEPGLVAWSMFFFNSIAHPTVMMRRDVLEQAGLYPAGFKGGTEDYALFMRLTRSTKVANLPEVVLRYRAWGGNMSTAAYDDQQREANRIVCEALVDLGISDASTKTAAALRGLALGRYPRDAADIRALADILKRLRHVFIAKMDGVCSTTAAINADVGVKLCLLAARAVPSSVGLALRIGADAVAVSPSAPARFAAKALSTIMRPR